jgi:hypothetical protein
LFHSPLSFFAAMSRPKLTLAFSETTTGSVDPPILTTEGSGDGAMLQLVGGEGAGIDLGATFEVSASGTLRAGGFAINQGGIQSAPGVRPNPASAQAAFSGSAPSPLTPLEGPATLKLNASDFLELGNVGRGCCGVVRRALHVPSLRVVALKEINIYDKEKRHQFIKELSALGSVASPYIVGFAGAFHNEGSCTVLLEYANRHSLAEMLQLHGPFNEIMLQRIALHSLKVSGGTIWPLW